jgi:hypothetical protein
VDNYFGRNVEKMLTEGEYYKYLFNKNLKELESLLLDWAKSGLHYFLPAFVSIKSFRSYADRIQTGEDASTVIGEWIKGVEPKTREEELHFFFRQYVKVIDYVQDKRSALKEKIAQEKFSDHK